MSEGMKLSQDEIDALLNRGSSPDAEADDNTLSDVERDTLGEVGNISFGSAATSLSTLLQQRVEITTPTVTVLRAEDVSNDFPRPYVIVAVEYTQGLTGSNALAIELNDAKTIADLMMGGDGTNLPDEINELHLSAVAEAMNQMMGGAATAMSTMFGMTINISPPQTKFVDMSTTDVHDLGLQGWIANTSFRLKVGDLIDSKLMQLVPVSFAKEVIGLLDGATQAAATAMVEPARVEPVVQVHSTAQTAPNLAAAAPVSAVGGFATPQSVDAPTVAQVPPTAQTAQLVGAQHAPMVAATVQRPEFVDFSAREALPTVPRNLSLLFDVNLNVTVELGRTRKSIREILDLAPGSIVELDKLAGEPVDILVNNKRIAIGEVVVIDENFGVRVTDIISPVERVKNLQ